MNQSEHNIQASFVDSVLWQYKNDPTFLRPLFFAAPNGAYLGGSNRPAMFQKLRKEGFLPGVADLLYLQPRGEWAFLALELKTEKRRREKRGGLSEEQIVFLDAVARAGGAPLVCYSVDEALEGFAWYMNREPGPGRSLDLPFDMVQSRALLGIKSEEPRP